jgi:hypothetical protein
MSNQVNSRPGVVRRVASSARRETVYRALLAVLACLVAPSGLSAQSAAPVELMVRVFDGVVEVTDQCTVKVYHAHDRDTPFAASLDPRDRHVLEVDPGIYDLQVTRHRSDDTMVIEWDEHLSVLRYPDETTAHLEVVNLQPAFGALMVRPPSPWLEDERAWRVSAFLHEGESRAGFAPVDGTDQRLFILPAGRYDLRARLGAAEVSTTGVEVPARRTRLLHLNVD